MYAFSCLILAKCPGGSFWENEECIWCPVGTYRDKSESIFCKLCPAGFTTINTSSERLSDCSKGICYLNL